MTSSHLSPRARTVRSAVLRRRALIGLAALLALPAGPASAESDPAFDASFAAFTALPPAPLAAAGAVDIAAIEPASEAADQDDGIDIARQLGSGGASYYAAKFHGRRTASGEAFDNTAMTAAHRSLPFGSKVRVTNPANGRSVTVRINDRGPFHGGRVIDVSRAAAERLGLVARGHGTVDLALVE